MRRLILRCFQSPGDILVMTAAVRDLHLACPGQFQTDVRTAADAIWINNPHITRLAESEPGVEMLDMHYPLIHQSNQRPYHFIHGYVQYLEEQLQVRIPVTRFHGDIHLAPEEKQLPTNAAELPESFWIVIVGGKYDFTAKWWNPDCYQQVVDHFQGKIQFVQCGEEGHWHPRLKNVLDLVGKTSTREFIRLMYHAAGVICPVTFAMHLAAAVESKPGKPRSRPCVVIAGGREPPHWEAYPGHQFLHTMGALPCCADGGCWRSRCQLVGDGDAKDHRELCERPVQVSPNLRIPKCMHMITAADVIRAIERYFEGGTLVPGAIPGRVQQTEAERASVSPNMRDEREEPETASADTVAAFAKNAGDRVEPVGHGVTAFADKAGSQPDPHSSRMRLQSPDQRPKIHRKVLIKFPHDLADAVELTIVLKHLRHFHPDWLVDVAAAPGTHSALHGLCHQVKVLGRDPLDPFQYHQVYDLEWNDCQLGYADRPSTKASRCLEEVFHLPALPELCTYPAETEVGKERHAAQPLLDTLNRIGTPRLLVLGDLILDRYIWGDAERVSPEAPVLVLRADEEEVRLGGAASVAGLLRALDAEVMLAGVTGDDPGGRIVRKLIDEAGIDQRGVVMDPSRATTAKDRFMGRAGHRHPQQILRVDREERHFLASDLERALCSRIVEQIPRVQAVLISDYAKGVCSSSLLAGIITAAKKAGIPVLIDPARIADYTRYRGAGLLTPNRVEAEMATGLSIRTPADALIAAEKLCADCEVPAAIVKLDKDGMTLSRAGEPGRAFPTRSRAVYDVTGAGDVVLAICGLCRASGIGWEETVQLANIAAGLEVEKLGVTSISRAEIRAELASALSQRPRPGSPPSKILPIGDLLDNLGRLRAQGKRVVFTNGCFDLLHVGHASYLQEAAGLGDVLVVAVNSDSSVRRLKGPGRPVVCQDHRAALLSSLGCVDYVIVFEADTPHHLLRQVRPEVLVKGGTYTLDDVVGKEIVETYGGRVCVAGKVAGLSTTEILAGLAMNAGTLETPP